MLAKKHRLSRTDFSQYFKQGKRFHSKFATLIFTPDKNHFHGAVVVSKKVNKQAVRRNTLRRRVYAQLYRTLNEEKTGVYIIVLKPAFNGLSRKGQHEEIASLIELVK